MKNSREFRTRETVLRRRHRVARILMLIADGGFIAWGGMAALAPEHLLGPKSAPILPAEYEGFTGRSWSELVGTFPKIADFITVLFRMYGTYCVIFGLLAVAITITAFRHRERWAWWTLFVGNTIAYASAITFDRVVNAIGIFEMSEYLGAAAVYVALAVTAPFFATGYFAVRRINDTRGSKSKKEEPGEEVKQ